MKNTLTDRLANLKTEIPKYLAHVKQIKPRSERIDKKGNDTFDYEAFWRGVEESGDIPTFCLFCRKILCYSPNSCPPERVFSILSDTFGDDQHNALPDYMELSLQKQFNQRMRDRT